MMMKKWMGVLSVLCAVGTIPGLQGQSIAEKKAALKTSGGDLDHDTERFLFQVNQETQELQSEIQKLYAEVLRLYESGAPESEYKDLLDKINEHKRYLFQLETSWRELVSRDSRAEGYGLWYAPDTSLGQLIIDYGSQDYVYLIPPEVSGIRVSVASNLPVPRASWGEMLEMILNQNGVGTKTLNPYLKQLYVMKDNASNVQLITNRRRDLEAFPSDARVSFVLSPEPSDVRRSVIFLEQFANPNTTTLRVLGRDILIIAQASEIQELLKLYDFVATNRGDKDYRLVPIHKISADEMSRILSVIFDQEASGGNGAPGTGEPNGLKIVPLENLAQALFLVGTKQELKKAEEVIQSVESKIGGARDKVVFWYTARHSSAEELADVLFRVYSLMITSGTAFENQPPNGGMPFNGDQRALSVDVNAGGDQLPPGPPGPPVQLVRDAYYQEGAVVVNPAPVGPGVYVAPIPNQNRDNFIVDMKTGSIVMVVEAEALPKIKDLIRRLDVQKKMVQIETLLFEKKLNSENSFGLNLLRLGDSACNTNFTGAAFNNIFPCGATVPNLGNAGVFDFFLSRKANCNHGAFDLIYRFLLSQDDIQINSSPSVLTVNQTPAQIAIVEDISINTGVFEFQTATGVPALKDAFTRAQYGITIDITPTIHMRDEDAGDDAYDYVTLDTDITFDTINPGSNPQQPDVTRRHITNEVQIADGQTVILGGLRRKVTNDSRDSIPFIGEVPGIGKLFSETTLKDSSSEMFIFITPRIVPDPIADQECMRQELLCRRPGDIPYFLECLEEAYQAEKYRLMAGSMMILFGRPAARYYIPDGEYDGR